MSAINLNSNSIWQTSFSFDHVKCLIVCRGPIRYEAMTVFEELKIKFGILISERDSVVYNQAQAPELRKIRNRSEQVHHVKDYMGSTKDEQIKCIEQIIKICRDHKYTHLFAGYGFMAEDADFVSRIENAGIIFVGPSSKVIESAGSKDEAKELARKINVSVTPGEDRIAAITLLKKAGESPKDYFSKLIKNHKLNMPQNWQSKKPLHQAISILKASSDHKIDLFSTTELQKETIQQIKKIWKENPGKRIRLKHVGGGGGKGQRIISSLDDIDQAVISVLIESKQNGVGDNKNFLIELNIEDSRHNEIQLIGNGEWCIELGGRDCSIQINEQKLLEMSLTQEMLVSEIKEYEELGKKTQAEVLRKDAKILKSMCKKAEEFGKELHLDSVSTFECILDNDEYYFMEVNTRIQVEHRVTELAYRLSFKNPDDPKDSFTVDSLVAAMILISCYGKRLPCPERIPRHASGVEARLNATNHALKPHAGGILSTWSSPCVNEIREDQGIGIPNPDTGNFLPYNLAGAYDSNVALSITHGISRRESFEKLAEILRCMEVRGHDLNLNIEFHYGLLHWLLNNDPMLKTNTNFVSVYLALAGKIKCLCDQINIEDAWDIQLRNIKEKYGREGSEICAQKSTLLLRPLKKLFSRTHLLMGWLSFQDSKNRDLKNQVTQNPIFILKDLYHFLRLEERYGTPASEKIWSEDQKILKNAIIFYRDLYKNLRQPDLSWDEITVLLNSINPPKSFIIKKDPKFWKKIVAAHRGHQIAMDILKIPEAIAEKASYFKLRGNDKLKVDIPPEYRDMKILKELADKLAPRPTARGNEILAWTGGTFYSSESPGAEVYVKQGQHIEEGDVLGLLEVMKMFNQIRAIFPGTIRKIYVEAASGTIVSRGQPLFLIDPDFPSVRKSEEENVENQFLNTNSIMQKILSGTNL